MLSRLRAQVHEIRLNLQAAWLRRQQRVALRQLGEAVAARPEGENAEVARLAVQLGMDRKRLESFTAEADGSLEADRSDLARVVPWMKPVVVLRGLCTRAVLRHRRKAAERGLRPRYEQLGQLAWEGSSTGSTRELTEARDGLDRLRTERERRLAPFGGTAHPAWAARAAAESVGLARAFTGQLRSALLPKAPALTGMAVGWWIANTYTDSRFRSALRSVGIGSGGTHVVSESTYKAMSFWLPLLAAAICAYLGERMVQMYRERL